MSGEPGAGPGTVVSRDLVIEVERAIAAERRAFALGCPDDRPGAAVLELDSGVAVYTGPDLFSNRVLGFGLNGPVPEEDLDRCEAFYAERGLRTEIEVASLVDPGFLRQLGDRRYRLERFRNIYAIVSPAARQPHPAVEVRPVVDDTAVDEWSRTLIDGFGASDPARREATARWNRGLSRTDGIHLFVGRLEGETVGAASVYVSGRAAVLGGAATLARWRRRGTQTALIAARLDVAHRAGCGLAVVTADPGSSSGRNAERAGFTLVCTHALLCRNP